MRGRQFVLLIFAAAAYGQESPERDLQTGLTLIQNGQYQSALEPLGRAAAARPDSFEPNYLLGLALSQAGRQLEAIKRLRVGQKARPGHTGLLTLLGVLYLKEGYPLDAAETLVAAAQQAPLPEKSALLIAEAWDQCFQFDKALASATETAARFPRSADAKFRLGYELETAGRFDEAHHEFMRAAELEPEFVEARVALARLERRMSLYDSSQQHLEVALRVAPKDRTARTELAKLMTLRKQNVKARHLLQGLISESDTEPELHLLLARVYQSEGDATRGALERARFMELSSSQRSNSGMSSTINSRKTRRFADGSH
jgi:Flp pilus assembly protein TadD